MRSLAQVATLLRRNADFRRLFLATIVSLTGDWFAYVAVSGFVAEKTGRAGVVTLVLAASVAGLPVSTTHVSVGSLIGIGLSNGKADFSVIRTILLSWLATLPIAAAGSARISPGTRRLAQPDPR